MTKARFPLHAFMALGMMALGAQPAYAENAAGADDRVAVDATISLVSDYRYRGISLSNNDPAIQGDITVSHETGLYAMLWASTIADNGGADLETQLSLGYALERDEFNLDVQAVYYLYPGASRDNYFETSLRLGKSVGQGEIGATISYAPAQHALGSVDNTYVGLDGNMPLSSSGPKLIGSFGIEDGAFGDRKLDWSLGVEAEIRGLSLSVSYVDSGRAADPLGNASVVASISKAF